MCKLGAILFPYFTHLLRQCCICIGDIDPQIPCNLGQITCAHQIIPIKDRAQFQLGPHSYINVQVYSPFCYCKGLPNFNTLRRRQNGRHFPDDIFNCIFFNKKVWISIKIHWSLLPRVKLTIFQHWFRWWLGASQATSHFLNQWWLIYWCIYASLGLNEFKGTLLGSMYIQGHHRQNEIDEWDI